ncbi:hypothetical protein U1Q18_043543, partial [Sarracenia purpurea var. burkii]
MIKDEGRWNSQAIRSMLPLDADLIEAIPLSVQNNEDVLVWHYSKDGRYSVRTGYYQELLSRLPEAGSSETAANGQ